MALKKCLQAGINLNDDDVAAVLENFDSYSGSMSQQKATVLAVNDAIASVTQERTETLAEIHRLHPELTPKPVPQPAIPIPDDPAFSIVIEEEDGEEVAKVRINRALVDRDADNYGYPTDTTPLDDNDPRLEDTQEKYTIEGSQHPELDPGVRDYTPERKALQEEWIEAALAEGETPQEGEEEEGSPYAAKPLAILTGGGGSAGKGTVLKFLQSMGIVPTAGFVHVDPDLIKSEIPEYKALQAALDSRAAPKAHEESSDVAKIITNRAIAGQLNIIIDKTLNDPKKTMKQIADLKKAGYEVRLVGVTIDIDEALIRALGRYYGQARLPYVPAMVNAHIQFNKYYEQYAKAVDAADIYDNTRRPEVIMTAYQGKVEIKNQKLYDETQRRGNIHAKEKTLRAVETPAGKVSEEGVRQSASRPGSGVERSTATEPEGPQEIAPAPQPGAFVQRSTQPKAKPKESVSSKDLKKTISTLLRVAPVAQKLGIHIYDTQDQAFGPGSVERMGIIQGGFTAGTNEMVLIAENIASKAVSTALVRHEVIGHFGFRELLNRDGAYDRLLKRVYQARAGELKKEYDWVARYYPKLIKDGNAAAIADEMIARASESKTRQRGFMMKIYDEIIKLLNRFGLARGDITHKELRSLIRASEQNLRRQLSAQELAIYPGSPQAVMARQERTEYQQAVDKGLDMSTKARLARAVEQGFDVIKVWYHGTQADFDAFQPNYKPGRDMVFVTESQAAGEHAARIEGVPGNVIPMYIRAGKTFDFQEMHNNDWEIVNSDLTQAEKEQFRQLDRKSHANLIQGGPALTDQERADRGRLQKTVNKTGQGYEKGLYKYLKADERAGILAEYGTIELAIAENPNWDRKRHNTKNIGDPLLNDDQLINEIAGLRATQVYNQVFHGNWRTLEGWNEQTDSPGDTRVLDWIKDQGYDSFTVKEVMPDGREVVSLGVLDPANLRSINAAFDPAYIDSSQLLNRQERSEYEQAVDKGLDMTKDARLARAKKMGFDTDLTFYHGTVRDFGEFATDKFTDEMHQAANAKAQVRYDAFRKENPQLDSLKDKWELFRKHNEFISEEQNKFEIGARTQGGKAVGGDTFFFTSSPAIGSAYAEPARAGEDGGQVIPVHLRLDRLKKIDAKGKLWSDFTDQIKEAKASGKYDGVILNNVEDDFNGHTGVIGSTVAVFDSANIRSVNAAYDPAFSDSSNLLMRQNESIPLENFLEGSAVQVPVFHGTSKAGFSQFKSLSEQWKDEKGRPIKEEAGGAFFFSTKKVAETYSNTLWPAYPGSDITQPGNYEVYLSLKNPLVLTAPEVAPPGKLPKPGQVKFGKPQQWHDPINGYSSVPAAVAAAKREGKHDGVIVHNIWDEGFASDTAYKKPNTIYAAFSANQVKSATDNTGAFDPNNPDMRFRRADEAEAAPVGSGLGMPEERWQETGVRWFQDSFNRMLKAQTVITEAGGDATGDRDVYRAEELSSGKISGRIRLLGKDYMDPLVKVMKDNKITVTELDAYGTAKHAYERNAWIATFNDDMQDGGSGMTYQEADNILARLEGREGFEEAFAIVRAVNDNTLDDLVEGGHITQEFADTLKTRWANYVPLKGIEGEEVRPGAGSGYSISGAGIKKAMGRGAGNRSESPVAHTFAAAEAAIVRTEKTKVGQALVALIRANPDPALWTISQRTFKKFRTLFGEAFEGYETAPEGMVEFTDYHRVMGFTENELAAAEAEGRKPIKKTLFKINPNYKNKPEVFAVMVAGEELLININDPILVEQLKKMNITKLNAFVRGFGMLNRYLAMVYTALNPEFVITNFERDFQTAMTNLGGEWSPTIAAKVAKGIPGAIHGIWQSTFDTKGESAWRDLFDEMQEEGGTIGFFGLEDIDTKVKKIQDSLLENEGILGRAAQGVRLVRDMVLDANLSVENASRLSSYKVLKEHAMTPVTEGGLGLGEKEAKAMAASYAKNLTVNFNRKGELAPVLNSGWLFYNASIQGSARIMLTALKHPGVRKIVGGMVAAGFANALFNRGVGGDDDDEIPRWDKMSDHLKQTNIIFMYPDGSGEAVKIKLPYGYNMFWYTGVAMADMVHGAKTPLETTGNMLAAFLNAFNPINGSDLIDTLMPTAIKPFTQHEQNENFMGAKIKPEFPFDNYDRPDSQKFYPGTNKLMTGFTTWMNEATGGDEQHPGAADISPEVLKHYLGWVTGGAGMFIYRSADTVANIATGNTADIEARNVPGVRTLFAKQSAYFDKERYYTAVRKVNAVEQRLKFLKGTPEQGEYRADNAAVHKLSLDLRSTKNKIKRLRAEQTAAYADEDRDYAREKSEEIRQIMMGFSMKYDEAIEAQE